MKAPSIALLALTLSMGIDAQFFPTAPVSDTVWTKGTTQSIEWKKQIAEAAAGNVTSFDIDLGTGSSNKVTILDSVAKGLDYNKTDSYTWEIPADKYKDDGKVYCFRFTGLDGRGDVTTTSWTTWFSMVNGTATTTTAPEATSLPVVPVVAPVSEIKSSGVAPLAGIAVALFAML